MNWIRSEQHAAFQAAVLAIMSTGMLVLSSQSVEPFIRWVGLGFISLIAATMIDTWWYVRRLVVLVAVCLACSPVVAAKTQFRVVIDGNIDLPGRSTEDVVADIGFQMDYLESLCGIRFVQSGGRTIRVSGRDCTFAAAYTSGRNIRFCRQSQERFGGWKEKSVRSVFIHEMMHVLLPHLPHYGTNSPCALNWNGNRLTCCPFEIRELERRYGPPQGLPDEPDDPEKPGTEKHAVKGINAALNRLRKDRGRDANSGKANEVLDDAITNLEMALEEL